jgi:hypothetical protein
MSLQKYVHDALSIVKHYSKHVAPINHLCETHPIDGKMLGGCGTVCDVTHCYPYITHGLKEGMGCTRKMYDLIALDVEEVVWGLFVQNCENT